MAQVQVRLVPVYRRLSFSPGFWAFTFSYAATATDALVWLTLKKPAGSIGYAVVVVAAMTGLHHVDCRAHGDARRPRRVLPCYPP
jgi:tellurite resistance protein